MGLVVQQAHARCKQVQSRGSEASLVLSSARSRSSLASPCCKRRMPAWGWLGALDCPRRPGVWPAPLTRIWASPPGRAKA